MLAHEKDLLTRSGPIVRWRRLGHASRLHSQSWFSRGFRHPCGHVHPDLEPLQSSMSAGINPSKPLLMLIFWPLPVNRACS